MLHVRTEDSAECVVEEMRCAVVLGGVLLFGKIDALLSAQPIRYIKWDHNRDLTTAGLRSGLPGYRAQVHAAYALFARIRAAHPEVEIESCSGGGGRIDFGVLRHTHRVWTSDCIDALSRVDIQRGFLQCFQHRRQWLQSHLCG